MNNTVAFEQHGHVASITLCRPQLGNPVDDVLCRELSTLWRSLADEPSVRGALVRARGPIFSVGRVRGPDHYLTAAHLPMIGPRTNRFAKPVVVELAGDVGAGAFSLIGEADLVFAHNEAQFFASIGGGEEVASDVLRLASRLPINEVSRLSLLGSLGPLGAKRALAVGLIDALFADRRALSAAAERAILSLSG